MGDLIDGFCNFFIVSFYNEEKTDVGEIPMKYCRHKIMGECGTQVTTEPLW